MSKIVGPKFPRVQTDLETKPKTHFLVYSQQHRDRGVGIWEWSSSIECKKARLCWSVWAGRGIGSHAREPPTVQQCSSGPHLPALISISMSASCSQYVITILPGFLALTANLKLQRLRFVRIQLVKRSGTKEAAASLSTIMPGLRNCYWINALLIGSKCQKPIKNNLKSFLLFELVSIYTCFGLRSCIGFVTSSGR